MTTSEEGLKTFNMYEETISDPRNPSFFDHFKRRSENTKHTFGNNEDLTPGLGGQFILANHSKSHCLYL